MDMVKSKVFGMGKVINKEVKEKGTYITVEFESGRQLVFGVPGSFLTGALEAVGSFKEEVDKAIAERKALEAAERESKKTENPASDESKKTVKHSKKSPRKVMPTGPVAESYEEYLIKEGYSLETDSGNPSTVYSYANAVQSVIEEEKTTWNALQTNISTIVKKYDIGGTKEEFGCKSNKTVINALRRFEEFVNSL